MRDTVFANCESDFVVAAIKKKKRLDGRLFGELRNMELHFGSDYGCAYVTLGETKVLAQVSCELGEPRNARKNEGNLFVNVEINDMVCGVFETGHQGHLGVHTNRLIEKCIKDSRCVDLEALCIISEEQAWEIRVDVSVLNYDGNLFTCSSLAALAALAHFKTPHVTIENSEVRIESIREHEPEPLSLHHYPVLVAFAIFGEGDDILLDPTELEEKVCESELVIGMNSYRELCGMHFSGRTTGNRLLIVKAAQQAALVAVDLVKLLKSKLEKDNEERKKNRGKTEGLVSAIHLDRILSASQDRNSLRVTMREIEETARTLFSGQKPAVTGMNSDDEKGRQSDGKESENEEMEVAFSKDKRLGVQLPPMEKVPFGEKWIPSGNKNAWILPNATLSDDGSDDSDDEVDFVKTITDEDRIVDRIELNDSDEEKETVMLGAKEAGCHRVPIESAGNVEHPPMATTSEAQDCSKNEICRRVNSRQIFCDSSSYSMTSPSYSSGSSLDSTSTSSGSYDLGKPNYDPPNADWSQPSTSCSRVQSPEKMQKKVSRAVYSPSSPSSSSSTSPPEHLVSLPLSSKKGEKHSRNPSQYRSTPKQARHESFLDTLINSKSSAKLSRLNRKSKPFKSKSKQGIKNKIGRVRRVAKDLLANKHKTERFPNLCSIDHQSPSCSYILDDIASVPPGKHGLASLRVPSPTYSPSSPSKPPPSGLGSADSQHPGSPVYVPSSPTESPTSPAYSSPKRSPGSCGRRSSFTPSPQQHQSHSDSNAKEVTSPLHSGNLSKQTPSSSSKLSRSPMYSPSSPSPSYSPTSCPYSSPKYSPSSKKQLSFSPRSPSKLNLPCEESSHQLNPSPTYSLSSPSKQPPSCPESTNLNVLRSPVYSPSSPSLLHSPTSSPTNSRSRKPFVLPQSSKPCLPSLLGTVPSTSFSQSSPSKVPPSPAYTPSSPSNLQSHSMSSPCKVPPSPDYTPSSPSKLPPSPTVSPSFRSSPSNSPSNNNLNNEIMTYLERKAVSSSSADSSSLYSPISSQSPAYSSDASSKRNKLLKKRVKLQRSSPTSPGSVVSELMEIGASKSSSSKKLKFSPSHSLTLPCSSRALQSGNGSPELSMPSPKYSPCSKMISSEVSEGVVPPYSPSSPSHPPPSPSVDPSSPSPVSSDRFSLSKVKSACTPELNTPPSYGSPHYSLDSLSSYSYSSFSSGLPSPSSGSPRYSPSPSESEALLNHRLTPSPPLSPSVMFTSPRVSSSSSSSPARGNPNEPSHLETGDISNALPTASLSMFSPSVSPVLPQFSPSSPSHQPPSPAYTPSSPSYSSRSCSPPESTSSGNVGNTFSSSPGSLSSHSSTSSDPHTLVLKVFLPKSS